MVSILQHTPFHNCGRRIWEALRNRNPLPCVAVNSHQLSAFLTILIYYMPNLPGSSSMIPRIQVQDLALRAYLDKTIAMQHTLTPAEQTTEGKGFLSW